MNHFVSLAGFALGVVLGLALGLVYTHWEPEATCAQTSTPLSIVGATSPRVLPAGTEFRLGRITDNSEVFVPIQFPANTTLETCESEVKSLVATPEWR